MILINDKCTPLPLSIILIYVGREVCEILGYITCLKISIMSLTINVGNSFKPEFYFKNLNTFDSNGLRLSVFHIADNTVL